MIIVLSFFSVSISPFCLYFPSLPSPSLLSPSLSLQVLIPSFSPWRELSSSLFIHSDNRKTREITTYQFPLPPSFSVHLVVHDDHSLLLSLICLSVLHYSYLQSWMCCKVLQTLSITVSKSSSDIRMIPLFLLKWIDICRLQRWTRNVCRWLMKRGRERGGKEGRGRTQSD